MVKLTKQFLMFCLIALQFVAPFIHAHAFGHDSFKAQVFHVHSKEISSVNNTLSHSQLGENHVIGAITTVASGIKTSVVDDIADSIALIAIFFTFVLLVFNASDRFAWQPIQALRPKRYFYTLQNPRAPPR